MANVKVDSLLLDAFASGQKASSRLQIMSSRTPASARADKIFNDPDSWGSGDSVEDLRSSPPFYDDDIYSGTLKEGDVENGYSSDLMVSKFNSKSAVNLRSDRGQTELVIKPFENKFHLQKRPSVSSNSDTSSSTFASSIISSATSLMDEMEPEPVSLVKPKWESVRDDVAEGSHSLSLSPLLEKSPKLKLDSISSRMSFFLQHQNIFRALQTPKSSDFDLGDDGFLTPWTPNSDFWKGKRVLDNYEKLMEKDNNEVALTRVGSKHKRTRTPPSIGPLTISTTTTMMTTTTTVVTVHSPALGTPASVTTIVSASTTLSILELYGSSPTSPQRGKLPLVPKTSGPVVTTFTPPSPSAKLSRRSSLPKSAFAGTTFGFVDAQDFLRIPGDVPFSSPKIVELPDNFGVADLGQPRIKAAPETTLIPAPRAPLTISIPDPKSLPKAKTKKVVRPLPRLPRASSPPPPVPALPNALPVLPPIPKHSPLPLPVTPALPSGSSASSSSSSSTSLKSPPEVPPSQLVSTKSSSKPSASRIPRPKKSNSISSTPSSAPLPTAKLESSTTIAAAAADPSAIPTAEPSDMKMRNLLRSQSRSELKASKAAARSAAPPPSKVVNVSTSKPPVPTIPPVPLLPSFATDSPQLVKESPSVPILPVPASDVHNESSTLSNVPTVLGKSEAVSSSKMPILADTLGSNDSNKVQAADTSKNRPSKLESSSLSLTPPSSSALSSSVSSSAASPFPGFRRMRSPSVSAADLRRTSDHSSPRNGAATHNKRQTSLQIPMVNVPFPDVATLAMRRNRSGSVSASTSPSVPPAPAPARKPSISSPRPNMIGLMGRTRKESDSVSSGTRSDVNPNLEASLLQASSSTSRTRKISSSLSSQPLTQTTVTSPPKSDVDLMMPVRKSPPPSSLQPPDMEKGIPGTSTGKTHSRTPSATSPPNIPIPPIPVDVNSSAGLKSTQGDSKTSNLGLTVPDIQTSVSKSPSRNKNSPSPIPTMNVPFPDAATLARRVTRKGSSSNLKRAQVNEPVPAVHTFPGRSQMVKNVSFTGSNAAPPVPAKSLKRVSSTPALRSSGIEKFDPPIPDASLLAKRTAKGVPDAPTSSASSSLTKAEVKAVASNASSSRPKAPPLPDIFFKPGTGKESKGKEKETLPENVEKKEVTEISRRESEQKDKGKQREILPPLPNFPVISIDPRLSKDSDKEFEKELDKAVSIKTTSSSSTSSSSSSKSVSDIKSSSPPTFRTQTHKQSASTSSRSKPPVPPLPDIFFKKTSPKEPEPVPKLGPVDVTVTVQPVSSSSKPVSESTRKRLSTVAPIVTDLKRPAPPIHAHTIPATTPSKHSRSRSLSSARMPVPKVVPNAPPVPSLPQLPLELAKSKPSPPSSISGESERKGKEDDEQVVVRSRRSRSPTRPMTPGGPRFRSRSVASSARVPNRLGSSAASIASFSSDAPLRPPPVIGREENRSVSPVTPGSRGRISPFPVTPRSTFTRMSIVTAA